MAGLGGSSFNNSALLISDLTLDYEFEGWSAEDDRDYSLLLFSLRWSKISTNS